MKRLLGEDLLALATANVKNSIRVRSASPDRVARPGTQKLYDDAQVKQDRLVQTVEAGPGGGASSKARSRSAPRCGWGTAAGGQAGLGAPGLLPGTRMDNRECLVGAVI